MSRRKFSTQMVLSNEPSFHEGEFMYMTAVYNARKKLMIHLARVLPQLFAGTLAERGR